MASKLLSAKKPVEILNPKPLVFEVAGQTFKILPAPDSTLMLIGDALSEVSGIFDTIANSGGKFGPEDIVGLGPQLIRVLVPNATALIAAYLKQPEDWVAENVSVAKKLEALKLILQVEDVALILKNWGELVAAFALSVPKANPTTVATPTPETAPTTAA